MYSAIRIVLFLHVLGGAVGLASMAVPLLARKGGRAHVVAGKVFNVGMTLAGLSGLLVTWAWLAAPEALKPGVDPTRTRVNAVFLGTIAVLTLNALWQGVRAVKRKRAPQPAPALLDVALPGMLLLAGLSSIGVGLWTGRWLLDVFGALSVAGAAGDLRFVLRPLETPMSWWYQHMNAMMVAIIGAVTAFLVFNAARFFPAGWQWVPWLAPSALIVPPFQVWIARYRRKFDGASSRRAREVVAA